MLQPTTITEQLIFTTTRIEIFDEDQITGTGTGFFFSIPAPDRGDGVERDFPFLVTNKHVVEGSTKIRLRMHTNIRGGDRNVPEDLSVDIDIPTIIDTNPADSWLFHPSPDVDLCIHLIGQIGDIEVAGGREIFFKRIQASFIPSTDDMTTFSAVENVLMVGYPNGLFDDVNNLPLVRRGITASHPFVDFRGKSIGVVDLACFAGSSGSPIFIEYEDRFAKRGATKNAGTVYFLGVLHAGPQMNQVGVIEVHDIPTVAQAISVTQTMIHLGYYIKSREVLFLAEIAQAKLLSEFFKHWPQPGGN